MKTFNDWYTRINEELAEPVATATTAEPTVDKADATADRDAMISDVDAIMTSLETLAGELKEELTESMVNEAESLVMQVFWYARKYRKAQQKVNNMKLKKSDMEMAMANLPREESDKKAYLKDKANVLGQSIKDIQSQINQSADDLGEYVERVVRRERMRGDIEVVKSQIGDVDDPKDLKDRLADLTKKSQEEEAVIQDFITRAETDAKDLKGDDKLVVLKGKKQQLKDAKADAIKGREGDELEAMKLKYDLALANIDLDIATEKGDRDAVASAQDKVAKLKAKQTPSEPAAKTTGAEPTNNEPVNNEPTNNEPANKKEEQLAKIDKLIDAEEKKIGVDSEIKAKIKEYEDGIKDLEAKSKKTKDDQGKIDMLKVALKNAKEKMKTSDELEKLKKKREEILALESWQLEGTALGTLLEMEITKLENKMILNESNSMSIKDRFARLI